ncbi:MAG TPA: PLD nuclease N-terminal domain-containing protein [Mycobacteriales bacterium]|nr:PLD nuclease N-terminal domain-containing protein [Mycobacteriales bacterium]
MIYGAGLLGLAELCLVVYCFLDVLRTPGARVRNLPKPVWLILCFIPPILGPLSWLLFGRPSGPAPASLPYKGNHGIPPEYDRPGRAVAANPDDDEAFLRALRERAQEQRRQARDPRDDES